MCPGIGPLTVCACADIANTVNPTATRRPAARRTFPLFDIDRSLPMPVGVAKLADARSNGGGFEALDGLMLFEFARRDRRMERRASASIAQGSPCASSHPPCAARPPSLRGRVRTVASERTKDQP